MIKPCVKCGGVDFGKHKNGLNKAGEQKWKRYCKFCEKIRGAKYRAENPEKIKIVLAKWYKKNKKKVKSHGAKYRAENQEKERIRHEKYYKENCEKIKTQQVQYRKENPGKINALAMKHYTLRRNLTPINCDFEIIKKVYIKAKYLNCEVDHVIPLNSGGLHVWENLQVIPKELNCQKHAKLPHPKIVKILDKIFEEKYGFCRLPSKEESN